MKQVVQNMRSGELGLWDVPAPAPRRGCIVVAVERSLISAGTEKMVVDLARAGLAGKALSRPDLVRQVIDKARREGFVATAEKVMTKLDQPVALGYSVAGHVIEVGEDVTGFRVGDRVACSGAGHAAHAEIIRVPTNLAVRIPGQVTSEAASFVALGAIALQGVRQAQPTLGERVVVLGLGLVGQLTVQVLKAAGCRVLGFDPDPVRRDLALAMGADRVAAANDLTAACADFTEGHGADAVLVTASTRSSEPVNTAARLSRQKGRVVVVGLCGMALGRDAFYRKELDLRLSMSSGPGRYDPTYEEQGHDYPFAYVRWTERRNMQAFLDLVADGRVTPERLVSHRFDIAGAENAYAIFNSGEPYLGIILEYPEARPTPTIMRRIERGTTSTATAEPRIGLIGAGQFAQNVLLPRLAKIQGVSLTTVVSTTGASARHVADRFGFQAASTDPADVLADERTDTVVIATRHDSHVSYTVDALASGKHVFCEKPLAIDEAGLAAVERVVSTNRALLAVGFNRRFAPLVAAARQALEGSGPLVMLYRINAGEVPRESWIWGEQGGGRVVGEVCHFVDTMVALAGATPIEVRALSARGHDDALTVQLAFSNGSIGTILYSSIGDPSFPKEYLEVFAPGRVVVLDDFRRLTIVAGRKRTVHRSWRPDKGHGALLRAFVHAIRQGGPSPIPFEEISMVTRATFQIRDALLG